MGIFERLIYCCMPPPNTLLHLTIVPTYIYMHAYICTCARARARV